MAISIGDAILHIGADTSKLDKSLQSIGQKMTQAGKNLTLKVTAPLAAFGALSIKTAADFSRTMAKVNAVTGATAEQFERLNEVAKELGRTTQFTASQVADAMAFMGMAGMDVNEILSAIPDTLNLAAAGALDMGSAANIVTNILAGFGMRTDQLGDAVDVLAKAFTSSNVDLLMLGESMKFAAPVAKAFGLTFEETAAIMGIFGNAGIQASLAGTSLRGAIVQLDKKAAQFGITMNDATGKMLPMADILEQLEAKGFTASQMMELFGLRAGPAMTALLDKGSASLREFTELLEDSGGTAQTIADVQMEGLHGSLVRLKSAFEGLQLTIADTIGPAVEGLVLRLRDLFTAFSDLPSPVRITVIALAAFAAALGPLLWMTGSLITNLTILKASFIGVKIASLATTGVLKLAIGAAIGLKAAFAALLLVVFALTLGIGMMVFGISKLISQKNALAKQAEREAELEGINTRLKEEHTKAMEGLENSYADVLKEAKELGFVLTEEQEAFLAATEAYLLASEASKMHREVLGLETEVLNAETGAINAQTMALRELANEKLKQLTGAYAQATAVGMTEEQRAEWLRLLGETARTAAGITVPSYQHGGPILEPTLLYGMSSKRVYAQAHEGEHVGPGGFKTANIYLQLDGRTLAQVIGEPLVEEIRLRTGARY